MLDADQWNTYCRDGYLRLGKLLSDAELAGLPERIDQIMLGTAPIDYSKTMMQLDSDTGKYEDAKPMTKGFKGATLKYRKIEELEYDPRFLDYIQHPMLEEICGPRLRAGWSRSPASAMFMNKPSRQGTILPWHHGPLDVSRSRSPHHRLDRPRPRHQSQRLRASRSRQPHIWSDQPRARQWIPHPRIDRPIRLARENRVPRIAAGRRRCCSIISCCIHRM